MVAQVINVVAIDRVLHVEPDLLIKQEHDDVIEERCHVCLTHIIVATTSDANGVTAWQVAHGVAEARNRRLALSLQLCEFTVYHFAIDDDWLKVAQLILQFTLCVPSTEEVDTFLDRVALRTAQKLRLGLARQLYTYLALDHRLRRLLLHADDAAAGTLNERCHALLKLDLHPLHVFKVQYEHVCGEDTTLDLATIN